MRYAIILERADGRKQTFNDLGGAIYRFPEHDELLISNSFIVVLRGMHPIVIPNADDPSPITSCKVVDVIT